MTLYFGLSCAWFVFLMLCNILIAIVRAFRKEQEERKINLFAVGAMSFIMAVPTYFTYTILFK